jgi:glutamate synthase domain-containing protein 3
MADGGFDEFDIYEGLDDLAGEFGGIGRILVLSRILKAFATGVPCQGGFGFIDAQHKEEVIKEVRSLSPPS